MRQLPTPTRRLEWTPDAGVVADRPASAQARALPRRRPLHHPANPDDSGSRTLSTTRARCWVSSGMSRSDAERLRELRRGLRDADVRRARLPAGRHRASTSSSMPATSRAMEVGLKFDGRRSPAREPGAVRSRHRRTRSSSTAATGGRTTLQERGRDAAPRRRGRVGRPNWGTGVTTHAGVDLAARRVRRRLYDRVRRRRWCRRVPGCPGVPPLQAYGERRLGCPGAGRGLEAATRGPVYAARSTSTIATPTLRRRIRSAMLRVGFAQRSRCSDVLREFVRVNNVADRNYVGLGDRRRHQRPLFRAGARAQLVRRRSSSRQPSSSDRYRIRATRIAVALHWLIAALVIGQFAWGWWMQEIAKQPPGPRVDAFNLHKSIGLVHPRA